MKKKSLYLGIKWIRQRTFLTFINNLLFLSNDAYEKLGLELWCLFSVYLKISIIFQKARVNEAYENRKS